MNLPEKTPPSRIIRNGCIACAGLGLALVLLGWLLVPSTSPISVGGACFILTAYGLVGWFAFGRIQPEVFTRAAVFGLIAGGIYIGEILLEYVLLPRDNTSWGLIEFGAVFFVIFLSGLVAAWRSKRVSNAILAALVTGMLGSMLWLIAALLTFYLFRGSARQALVFAAEGNYADFARSGMGNFDAFMMEDFFGAGFFHLLLAPLIAAILGTLGGWLGKGLFRINQRGKT